jgi:hypothetical protein
MVDLGAAQVSIPWAALDRLLRSGSFDAEVQVPSWMSRQVLPAAVLAWMATGDPPEPAVVLVALGHREGSPGYRLYFRPPAS